jgi:hypothetical protein
MKLPSYPQKGKPVEDTVRGLIDFVRASRIASFIGGRVVETANGTTLIADKPAGRRGGGSYRHPFQLVADEVAGNPVLRVADGAFQVVRWVTNGNTIDANAFTLDVQINADTLGTESTDGYLTLSPSTDYGVFIVADKSVAALTSFTNGTGTPWAIGIVDPIVIISSTYTESTDTDNLTGTGGTHQGKAAWYLGKVEVDADDNVTLTQHQRSDIAITTPVWVIPTIVSADANNSVSVGSDGGAYYDEP